MRYTIQKKIRSTTIRLRLLILIFSIASILSGCADDKTGSEPVKTKDGGALYFGLETDFAGFDVLGAVSRYNQMLCMRV